MYINTILHLTKRQYILYTFFAIILNLHSFGQQRVNVGYSTGNMADTSYSYYGKENKAYELSTSIGGNKRQVSLGLQVFLGKSETKTVQSFFYETELSYRRELIENNNLNKFIITPSLGYLIHSNLKKEVLVTGVFVRSGVSFVYSQFYTSFLQGEFETAEGPTIFLTTRIGLINCFS
ncbi:MAG: hypothetical protein ACI93L_000578 [Cyclobacteriaceae bacterium]